MKRLEGIPNTVSAKTSKRKICKIKGLTRTSVNEAILTIIIISLWKGADGWMLGRLKE
jgi:hypothetical protein